MNASKKFLPWIALAFLASSTQMTPLAQAPAGGRGRGGGRGQGVTVVSPEVSADRKITFRVVATNAQTVRLSASDIPTNAITAPMAKTTNGIWEVTVGPVEPGAYRYNFNVDGLSVLDPRNPAVSESNNNSWSLVAVPGSEIMDTKDVPHGAVASVTYYSTSLKTFRRMHVYTPPGYENGEGKFPILYLLHGAGDCDDSWTSVGRAGFILDNLIAAKKAEPMVIVMPAGHTGPTGPGGRGGARGAGAAAGDAPVQDEFTRDFLTDIQPYAESHYRVYADRKHRAIAGLSMGGSQTMNIAFLKLEQFSYIGIYSSGIIGGGGGRGAAAATTAAGAPARTPWEEQHLADLDNPKLKEDLKLLWFSTGKDDSLISTSRATVDLLKRHGFNPVFVESTGAHTWLNWRNYLAEFSPQLFH